MTIRTKFDVASDELDKRIALLGNRLNCIGWMFETRILLLKTPSPEITEALRIAGLRGCQLVLDRAAIAAEKIKPVNLIEFDQIVKLTEACKRSVGNYRSINFPEGGSLN